MKRVLSILILILICFSLFAFEEVITVKMRGTVHVKVTEIDDTFAVDVDDDHIDLEVQGAIKLSKGLYAIEDKQVILIVNRR